MWFDRREAVVCALADMSLKCAASDAKALSSLLDGKKCYATFSHRCYPGFGHNSGSVIGLLEMKQWRGFPRVGANDGETPGRS
jgi:hypothetical protein